MYKCESQSTQITERALVFSGTSMTLISSVKDDELRHLARQIAEGIYTHKEIEDAHLDSSKKVLLTYRGLTYAK